VPRKSVRLALDEMRFREHYGQAVGLVVCDAELLAFFLLVGKRKKSFMVQGRILAGRRSCIHGASEAG
jgi:hypothetical protein